MRKRCAFAMLAVALVTADGSVAATSRRPSFDCAKATGWAEKAICADPALADLDRRMAEVYGRLSASVADGERASLTDSQRTWLAGRNACERASTPLDCLRLSYQERLGALVDLETGPASAPRLPPVITSTFVCEDGRDLRVTFHTVAPTHVVIVAGRRTIDLPQATSASGARYTDGVTTFWNKGDQALFEWANGSTHCRARQ